ncbi:MAG TPA: hypothetical protein VNL77_17200, partial [Roseiflexaceae bacterium]|nr:hypothetical protein [Roseiflexaceae bacterium]
MADDRPTRSTPRSILNAVTASSAPSVVVPVLPGDQLDAVAEKVRAAGAPSVQLLVPEGAAAFRSPRSFRVLRVLLGEGAPQLQVISGDPRMLEAARAAGMDTLGV